MSKHTKNEKPLIAFALTALVGVGSVGNINQGIAGSDSSGVSLSSNVNNNCTLQTVVTVAFGAYDPVVTNASAALDANGSFDIKCNKGAVAVLSLSTGNNPAGPNRRMSNGASSFLTYNLYTSAARSTIWNMSNTVSYTAPNGNPFTETVYGRIPGAQINAATGSYSDTVVITATY